jgi:hypothetical protein
MFERSEGNIIVWIVINLFGIFFINCKITCSKHSNLESGNFLFFSNFLLKIEEDFNIDDYEGKRI